MFKHFIIIYFTLLLTCSYETKSRERNVIKKDQLIGPNLILNGDFSNELKNWIPICFQKNLSLEKVKIQKNNLGNSVLLDTQIKGEQNLKLYSKLIQKIKIEERNLYRLEFSYKINKIYNKNHRKFGLEVKIFDKDSDSIQIQYNQLEKRHKWAKFTSYIYCPADSKNFRLGVFTYNGQFEVKNFSLYKIKTSIKNNLKSILKDSVFPSQNVESKNTIFFKSYPEEFLDPKINFTERKRCNNIFLFGSVGEKVSFQLNVKPEKDIEFSEASMPFPGKWSLQKIAYRKKHKFYAIKRKNRLYPIGLIDGKKFTLKAGELNSILISYTIPKKSLKKSIQNFKFKLGNKKVSIPITLRVFNFQLPKTSSKTLGLYFTIRAKRNSWQYNKDFSADDYGRVYKDMKAHGMQSVVIDPLITFSKKEGVFKADISILQMHMNEIKKAGIVGPIIIRTRLGDLARLITKFNPKMDYGKNLVKNKVYKNAVKTYFTDLNKAFPKNKYPEFIIAEMDEIFKHPESMTYAWKNMVAPIKKYFPKQKIFLTISPDKEKLKIIENELDAKCFGGQGIDTFFIKHQNTETFTREMNPKKNDDLWVYYNRGLFFQKLPKFQRLMNGMWLWFSPFKGNLPWAYSDISGDYTNFNENGRRGNISYVNFTKERKIISSPSWEAMAKGRNDMLYLDKLYEIKNRSPKASIFLKQLQRRFHELRQSLLLLNSQTTAKEMEEVRWKAGRIIENFLHSK